jgi:hypothetical protein
MIKETLNFLTGQLNDHFGAPDPEKVELISFVDDTGKIKIGEGLMGLMLVNVEEERYMKSQLPNEKRNGENVQFANPEIKLNLLALIAANPGNDSGKYALALERLSKVIIFFQGTSYFDKSGFPTLDPKIERLTVELYTLSLEQQNQLWASLGAKYLPSVVYKIRLVVIDALNFGKESKVIKTTDYNLHRIN